MSETLISPGLLEWLRLHFKPSEEARLFMIKDLGELGEELPNLQIEPEFELVGLGDPYHRQKPIEYRLRLSWTVDETSGDYATGLCLNEFNDSLCNTVKAGLLPKDGYFIPATRTTLIKNFDRNDPLLCLPQEIHDLRQAAHRKINEHFNAAINFSP